ncbi:hypothetical protein FQN57_003874 [Myotisia sp. PD_48]|nr:hypothetical protein FQN57_003874 [Myotisia sp. PD_48]
MPIHQDPDRQAECPGLWDSQFSPRPTTTYHGKHKVPEQSTEDQIMSDSPVDQAIEVSPRSGLQTSNREELIRSIKNGESPTWVPNPTLEQYFAAHGDSPHERLEELRKKRSRSPLLPAAEIQLSPRDEGRQLCHSPVSIERPRSALHSGDFREGSQYTEPQQESPQPTFDFPTSPRTFWSDSHGTGSFKLPQAQNDIPFNHRQPLEIPGRSRAPSLGSFSSSYVLKPPTSPLVFQANNPDLDFSLKDDPMDLSMSPEKVNRRRTLPPETFRSLASSPILSASKGRSPRLGGVDKSLSYRTHHARRSITSAYSLQIASSPQSPQFFRSRRPSYSTDASPLHHASMVGSYEESILRGRMSTNPSKPLDFTAQIGVLGRGNCKPSLKCPPHVTIPFPAVFYSYSTPTGGRNVNDDSPSPYVGFIDLETSLPPETRTSQKSRRRHPSPRKCPCRHPFGEPGYSLPAELRSHEKRPRRPNSPKSPPGGCYRIPQEGQLQIIVKNPNKTAVKLFLVPYDLNGMEPKTKTFIRQRIYSTGPIATISDMKTSRDITSSPSSFFETHEDKPVLRYMIHLNICCPSIGRYYLYSGIRVVFANRVPDGKEKLRTEVQYPEPRFSPYKPSKDGGKSATERAQSRHNSGFGFGLKEPLSPTNFNSTIPLPPTSRTLQFSPNIPRHHTPKTQPYRNVQENPPHPHFKHQISGTALLDSIDGIPGASGPLVSRPAFDGVFYRNSLEAQSGLGIPHPNVENAFHPITNADYSRSPANHIMSNESLLSRELSTLDREQLGLGEANSPS